MNSACKPLKSCFLSSQMEKQKMSVLGGNTLRKVDMPAGRSPAPATTLDLINHLVDFNARSYYDSIFFSCPRNYYNTFMKSGKFSVPV